MTDQDSAWSDDEMKKRLQDSLESAHDETGGVDLFATDALGNTPEQEKSTGDPDSDGEGESEGESDG